MAQKKVCQETARTHLIRVKLSDTMPVHRCAILVVVVLDVNDNLVTPTRLDFWSGEGGVEHLASGLLEPVCVKLQ